ncbi:MAG TPA: pseudaminic acid biosynthesis-associated methylase [Nevskiales bacterium]|nr:pseudaminic acid biosynthesis-associated methylase [Nevskiales bacterium]
MSSSFKTEQEKFWAGEFGNAYSNRNIGDKWIASNTALFSRILARTLGVASVIEFGANIGLNLRAIRNLLPAAELTAIEINKTAAESLVQWGHAEVFHQSILDFEPSRQWDFVLIKGVLIHINPGCLPRVYDALYASSGRYICVVEYFNPTPVTVPYHGQDDKLFKRDFAGELLDRFNQLRLVDYGFTYHRDPNFPQDDTTWFLLEKDA